VSYIVWRAASLYIPFQGQLLATQAVSIANVLLSLVRVEVSASIQYRSIKMAEEPILSFTKSNTDYTRQPCSEPQTTNFTKSSLPRFLLLPIEIGNLTLDFGHSITQPGVQVFSQGGSASVAPISLQTFDEQERVDAEGESDEVVSLSVGDIIMLTPPVINSDHIPMPLYHSFPEPKFSDELRKPSWLNTVVAKTREKVERLWSTPVSPPNLLRRIPLIKEKRQSFVYNEVPAAVGPRTTRRRKSRRTKVMGSFEALVDGWISSGDRSERMVGRWRVSTHEEQSQESGS
jgi:hypothetical protein